MFLSSKSILSRSSVAPNQIVVIPNHRNPAKVTRLIFNSSLPPPLMLNLSLWIRLVWPARLLMELAHSFVTHMAITSTVFLVNRKLAIDFHSLLPSRRFGGGGGISRALGKKITEVSLCSGGISRPRFSGLKPDSNLHK